jgi:hypothetical protein
VNRFEANDIALARRMALMAQIQRFIDGVDVSLEAAGLIEAGLDDAFPDNDWIADKVLMLASYRPGGGESLYDEHQVRVELEKVLPRLR